jgi:MFS transporter, DHA2 family, methylenomycin A resistance protein
MSSPRAPNLKAILFATCLGYIVVQLDVSVVNVGIGALETAFGASMTGLQWVINAYALVFSALLISGGAVGDRFGAKTAFIAGFAVFTIGSIGCGLALTLPMLISLRCIQGVGAAMLLPTSLTLIRHSFHDAKARRSAVAAWGAFGGVAMAAGPILGGLMIKYIDWRSIFLLNVPFGLLAIYLIAKHAGETERSMRGLDITGQVTLIAALGCLTYGLTETSSGGWENGVTSTFLVAFALLIAAFAFIECKTSAPMLPLHLLKNRSLIATTTTAAATNVVFFGTVFVLSLYFQSVLRYDSFATGVAFIPLTSVLSISSIASARVAHRVEARHIITSGLVTAATGFAILTQTSSHSSPYRLDGALILVGAGISAAIPSLNNSMLGSVAKGDAGVASGLMASARQVGGVIGVSLFGSFVAGVAPSAFLEGMRVAMLFSTGLMLVCASASLYAFRRMQVLADMSS